MAHPYSHVSKVGDHGVEPGKRTSGVGALLLEASQRRRAVTPRGATGVRPRAAARASLILGFIFTLLGVALMFLLSWFKPAGQVGDSMILADRDTGAVYVMVDGRLHPALNLTSARLIAGQASKPDVRQGGRAGQVPAGAHGRHRRRARGDADAYRRRLAVGDLRHRPRPPTPPPRRWSPRSADR